MHNLRLAAVLLLALAACPRSPPPRPSEPPSIQGEITAINRSGERLGTIRVEAVPDDSAGSAKAVTRVTQRTEIRRGETVLEFNALEIGQWVSVWFTGPVRESYPVQADAAFIQIDQKP
jgi:hypothetical protein